MWLFYVVIFNVVVLAAECPPVDYFRFRWAAVGRPRRPEHDTTPREEVT